MSPLVASRHLVKSRTNTLAIANTAKKAGSLNKKKKKTRHTLGLDITAGTKLLLVNRSLLGSRSRRSLVSTSTEEHVGDTVSDDGTGDSATHGRRRLGEKTGLALLLDVSGLRWGGSMLRRSMLSRISGGVGASGLGGGGVGGSRGTGRRSRL